MENSLVGPKEMAEILKVPTTWIYQRTSLGQEAIPFLKIGKYVRFNPNEVIEFFKKKEIQINNDKMSSCR